MEELKPCPFCGHEASINNNFSEPYVKCSFGGCISNLISAWRWNRRPIEDALRKEIEALQKKLDEMMPFVNMYAHMVDGDYKFDNANQSEGVKSK